MQRAAYLAWRANCVNCVHCILIGHTLSDRLAAVWGREQASHAKYWKSTQNTEKEFEKRKVKSECHIRFNNFNKMKLVIMIKGMQAKMTATIAKQGTCQIASSCVWRKWPSASSGEPSYLYHLSTAMVVFRAMLDLDSAWLKHRLMPSQTRLTPDCCL